MNPHLSTGLRAYVYVLPCRHDEILKLGFSRDPLFRMQQLHKRYFDFFDLERGFLIETDHVKDARHIENEMARQVGDHSAPAPVAVSRAASGHTEWYRGAYSILRETAQRFKSLQGYALHPVLRDWMHARLCQSRDALFEWSLQTYAQLRSAQELGMPSRNTDTLLNALDAFQAAGVRFDEFVPAEVLDWYRSLRNAPRF